MNKYYTEFVQHKKEATGPRPAPCLGKGPTPTWSGGDDPPYQPAGPGGPNMNKVGFPMVRSYTKGQMSPEMYAQSGPGDDIGPSIINKLTGGLFGRGGGVASTPEPIPPSSDEEIKRAREFRRKMDQDEAQKRVDMYRKGPY